MSEICSIAELHAHYGDISTLAARKEIQHLDRHAREFIARSPFLVMSTADADGWPDASPKGDAPGFATVEDDRHLLLPDRIGNNRVDGFKNLMTNPKIGLIFFVPGVDHTLRINGHARLLTASDMCARFSVNGKPARAVVKIKAEQVFFHCGKALIRSKLWNPEARQAVDGLATLGAALADQIGGMTAGDAEEKVQESIRSRLY
jgi:uncharacterized protein